MTTTNHFAYTLQPDAASPGAAPAGAPAGSPQGCMSFEGLLPILIFLPVLYFFAIRPEQKREKERQATLKALKKGDIVRTSSGIRGEIMKLTEREVDLKIADKTKINVLRSHIAGPDQPASADAEGEGK